MNREEVIKKIEKLIMNDMKLMSTSICHLEDFNIEWMGKYFIDHVKESDELMTYIRENLK